MPFRLVSEACLPSNGPKVDKTTFYAKKIGKDKFLTVENAISKWAEEKGIPM